MTVVAWLLLFFFLYSVFDYSILERTNPNQMIVTQMNGDKREIVLQRNAYGHYVVNGTINEQQVTFLLDTGATDIAISESLANRLELKKGRKVIVNTANGNIAAYQTRLDNVALGDIILYDLNATILSNLHGNEALLGMNFLKHFEITQKGNTLTITQ